MDALGINPVLLTAQIISFLVVLAVLNKFLYKKIRQALEGRRAAISAAIGQRAEIEKRLTEIEKEREILRKSNQAELKAALSEARDLAEQMRQETTQEAELRAKRIIDQAKDQIEQEKLKASQDLKIQATFLAKEMTQKLLMGQKKNRKFQKLQLDQSLKELG